jgi:excisionase family DNA binding protein
MTAIRVDLPDELVERLAEAVASRLSLPSPEPEPAAQGKLAVSVAEAADLLGVSADHFRRRIQPELRIVRSGRLRLVPVAELETWLQRHAARALTGAQLAHRNGRPHEERDRGGAQGSEPEASA